MTIIDEELSQNKLKTQKENARFYRSVLSLDFKLRLMFWLANVERKGTKKKKM